MKRFILHFLFLLSMIIVNALANIIPLNGQTTGEISNKLDVLFTPAGYVFSIWSLIYFLLFIWVLRGGLKSQRKRSVYKQTSTLFVVSSILNCSWIVVWHYEQFIASVAVMIGLLFSLILIYVTIQRNKPRFLDRLPFSVYLGWISIATIANISYTLNYHGWSGFGLSDVSWTIILLLIATALALHIRFHERDWIYPLVFIWAFIGIAAKNEGGESIVVSTAYVLSAIIAIGIITLRKKKKQKRFSSRKRRSK
ncbi:TspO/MBR family protein [Jeotgalibacillus marinus]|uniref:TspO/MBR family protein n=1 Tax=Jeotgalibacillus marinus TaxID=86667 RepID=A0ABV3Q550_9BACL